MTIGNPQTLGLPYDSWRKGQEEVIEQIASSGKKYIVLQAPTGTGKTLIGMSLAALAAKEKQRSVMLCKTKQLQTQYAENFPGILHVVKGRQNFACNVYPGLTADNAPCAFIQDTEDKAACLSKCEYRLQREKAGTASIVSANYSYYLYSWKYTPNGLANFDLVVCDEAHLLENELTRFSSVNISKRALASNRIKYYDSESLSHWKQWAFMNAESVEWRAEELESNVLTSMRAGEQPDQGTLHLARFYSNLANNLRAIASLNEHWVVTDNPRFVKFNPIWVNDGVSRIFEKAKKVVFMSATVLDPNVFTNLLGIEDYEYFDLPCLFPLANRPIYFMPSGYMSYKRMDAELPKLTQALDSICDAHSNHKGVVHTHNYRITDYILKHSRHAKYMLTHTVENREEILAMFKRAAPPAILLSPSMGTGVSLEDDLARYSIIAKMPFPDQSDKVVSSRLSSANSKVSWYSYATAAELMQSTGRIVRSETDWGVNYILDSNFSWFIKQNNNMFPQWWLDALQVKK